jgi:hypothetical protein
MRWVAILATVASCHPSTDTVAPGSPAVDASVSPVDAAEELPFLRRTPAPPLVTGPKPLAVMFESGGLGFFEKTFFLEPDGEVIVKKKLGYRYGYQSFQVSRAELARVLRVLHAEPLLKAKGSYGYTHVFDLKEKDLKLNTEAGKVIVRAVGVIEGECDVRNDGSSFLGSPTAIPKPFVQACQVIEQLRHDHRAKAWKPKQLKITFRTGIPDDKRASLGHVPIQWSASIPAPKGGFREPWFSVLYDGKYLNDFFRLVGSPHGAQLVTIDGKEGYVDYDTSLVAHRS